MPKRSWPELCEIWARRRDVEERERKAHDEAMFPVAEAQRLERERKRFERDRVAQGLPAEMTAEELEGMRERVKKAGVDAILRRLYGPPRDDRLKAINKRLAELEELEKDLPSDPYARFALFSRLLEARAELAVCEHDDVPVDSIPAIGGPSPMLVVDLQDWLNWFFAKYEPNMDKDAIKHMANENQQSGLALLQRLYKQYVDPSYQPVDVPPPEGPTFEFI